MSVIHLELAVNIVCDMEGFFFFAYESPIVLAPFVEKGFPFSAELPLYFFQNWVVSICIELFGDCFVLVICLSVLLPIPQCFLLLLLL